MGSPIEWIFSKNNRHIRVAYEFLKIRVIWELPTKCRRSPNGYPFPCLTNDVCPLPHIFIKPSCVSHDIRRHGDITSI